MTLKVGIDYFDVLFSNQKFKVLMVKGSPFVSLSISPTKGGND